jgi:hypothetical protein
MSYRGQMKAFAHCARMTIFSNEFNAKQVKNLIDLHRVPTTCREFASPDPVITNLLLRQL